MEKICEYCGKQFLASGKNSWKKIFCDVSCQQKYWADKRNKTGKTKSLAVANGKEVRKIHLKDEQLQLCLGGMMGDSSITPKSNGNCRLKMCHCEKQLDYLTWKSELLNPFISNGVNLDNREGNSKFNSSPSYYSYTYVHQDFTDLFGLFYLLDKGKKRKTVNMNILNKLKEFGILIWFLDDGHYSYNEKKFHHVMYLSTYRYSLGEHQSMKKWFWHKWRIESTIYYDKTHNKYTLRFNKEALLRFNNLFLSPFKNMVPQCMHYKFPEFNSALPADSD